MKSISIWAKNHVLLARISIVAIKVLLAFLAYTIGMYLYSIKLLLPFYWVCFIAFALLLLVLHRYEFLHQHKSMVSFYYAKERICHIVLNLCGFVVLISTVNNLEQGTNFSTATNASTISIHHPSAAEILASLKSGNQKKLSHKDKRILKKEFYQQLKILAAAKMSGNKKTAGEAGLIILAIIAALGLLYLLAGLACSISCSGNDVAAIGIGLLGLIGIIWGLVAVIKAIKRKSSKSPPDKNE